MQHQKSPLRPRFSMATASVALSSHRPGNRGDAGTVHTGAAGEDSKGSRGLFTFSHHRCVSAILKKLSCDIILSLHLSAFALITAIIYNQDLFFFWKLGDLEICVSRGKFIGTPFRGAEDLPNVELREAPRQPARPEFGPIPTQPVV